METDTFKGVYRIDTISGTAYVRKEEVAVFENWDKVEHSEYPYAYPKPVYGSLFLKGSGLQIELSKQGVKDALEMMRVE